MVVHTNIIYDESALTSYGVDTSEHILYHTMMEELTCGRNINFENMEEEPHNEEPLMSLPHNFIICFVADQVLCLDCESHSKLSFNARQLNIKIENKLFERGFNQIVELILEIFPPKYLVFRKFYDSKQLMSGSLPVNRIDCCEHNYILYWGANNKQDFCKVCCWPRLKADSYGADDQLKKNSPKKEMFYLSFLDWKDCISPILLPVIWHGMEAALADLISYYCLKY